MGKVKGFAILLSTDKPVYFPGQTICGSVRLELTKPLKATKIVLVVNGFASVRWKANHAEYKDSTTYVDHQIVLWTRDRATNLTSGANEFDFAYQLPRNIPSSFESHQRHHAHVRYLLTAKVVRPWKFDVKSKKPFTIVEHADVNRPEYLVPLQSENSVALRRCLGCASGTVTLSASLDRRAYCAGERINGFIAIENASARRLKGVLVRIVAYKTLHARRREQRTCETISRVKLVDHVAPRKRARWVSRDFDIPPVVPSIRTCRLISLDYYFEVLVLGANRLSLSFPILVGTVPLEEGREEGDRGGGMVRPSASYVDNRTASTLQRGRPRPSLYLPPTSTSPDAPVPSEPPSYAEAVGGLVNIADGDSDQFTRGELEYAPMYPFVMTLVPSAPPPPYSEEDF